MTSEEDAVDAERPQLIDALLRPEVYPHPVRTPVRVVETHASWVFLTGRHAYKIKKPVDLGFLDFSTLARRVEASREEVRLNRRLAAHLYEGLVWISGPAERPVLGEPGADRPPDALEICVRMWEFPQEAQLDRRFAAGRVGRAEVLAMARSIVDFHAGVERASRDSPYGEPEAVMAPVRENFEQIAARLPEPSASEGLHSLRDWSERKGRELARLFADRKRNGFVRECHGDLHLSNLVDLGEAGGIVAIDCLEFDPALRWIDVVCDNAFLMMDLLARDADGLAYDFASGCLEATGDYEGARLLPFYLVYRTLVRAKVAGITLEQRAGRDAAAREKFDRHLRLAARIVARAQPALILTHGVSGSGKTHVTTRLIGELRALRVRSDLERKRLFGLSETDRSDSGMADGIYSRAASDRTFARLLGAARHALAAGCPVIVDATFLRRERREPFIRLARELGVPWALLALRADREVLRARVAQRSAQRRDASEADLVVLEAQLAEFEPLDEAAASRCVSVDTTECVDVPAVAARLTALLGLS